MFHKQTKYGICFIFDFILSVSGGVTAQSDSDKYEFEI